MSLKSQNGKKIYKEKIIRIKKIVNVDNNEENVYEKIILQDAEHDDNIDLEEIFLLFFYYFGEEDEVD